MNTINISTLGYGELIDYGTIIHLSEINRVMFTEMYIFDDTNTR